MSQCKEIFKVFLKALLWGDTESVAAYTDAETRISMNMLEQVSIAGFPASMRLTEEFRLRFSTMTNVIELSSDGKEILFADVHHLVGKEVGQQLYPLTFGGKYRFEVENGKIRNVWFDLEYLTENTYLVSGNWKPLAKTVRTIPDGELLTRKAGTPEEALYLFLWAVDTQNASLAKRLTAESVEILRAGAHSDSYTYHGNEGLLDFLEKDKLYFSQNQYSVHSNGTEQTGDQAVVQAWRLYPAHTGNKHRGVQNKYTQFYNEIVTGEFEHTDEWKLKKITFKRKENPTPYGYEMLEL